MNTCNTKVVVELVPPVPLKTVRVELTRVPVAGDFIQLPLLYGGPERGSYLIKRVLVYPGPYMDGSCAASCSIKPAPDFMF